VSHYISTSDFGRIIEKLLERSDVFAPLPSNDRVYFEKVIPDSIDKIVYDTPRQVDPPKSFLYPARELVAKYFAEDSGNAGKPVTIIGVKGCDAAAIAAYDRVMLEGDFIDPLYKERRESTLLIGTDCASIWTSCFCTLVGLKPYPESGVDINLSSAENGFVVSVKSEKGKAFFEEFSFFFREATTEELAEFDSVREKTISLLAESNKQYKYKLPIHEIVKGTLDTPAWRKITRLCVECGACNISCPSCTCFMLHDKKTPVGFERQKIWDACLKGGYARVAGGANSRPFLSQRYNNRLQCKFDYSFDRLNKYTCTGCGRCIEACPAKIDMRAAIVDLEIALALSAKLE
jgi:ferredoxin